MRYSSLFVFMFLAGSAFAQPTNLSSTAQKELEQLDAQQQHRQQTLLEQKDAQFSAQSNVQFTKPPTSSLSLPEQEQPCFQVNKILLWTIKQSIFLFHSNLHKVLSFLHPIFPTVFHNPPKFSSRPQ